MCTFSSPKNERKINIYYLARYIYLEFQHLRNAIVRLGLSQYLILVIGISRYHGIGIKNNDAKNLYLSFAPPPFPSTY